MENLIPKIKSFVARWHLLIIIAILVIPQISLENGDLQAIFKLIVSFLIVFVLSSIAIYSFTELKFTDKENKYNTLALAIFFLAITLLVVGITQTIYPLEHKPKDPIINLNSIGG